MKTNIQKLLKLQKFFNTQQETCNKIILNLEKPSALLLQNIHFNWLKFINKKSSNHFPIYLKHSDTNASNLLQYGSINQISTDNIKTVTIDCEGNDFHAINTKSLELKVIVPQTDIQSYIQWQRYRKYWWSSVTTTPSLFSIGEMNHDDTGSYVNIIANFNWGQHIVETVNVNSNIEETSNSNINKSSCLTCSMGMETAFLTLLLDGLYNTTKEEYLRLHNKLAPYKISFALDSEGEEEDLHTLSTLKELSVLLYHKLKVKNISAWLPSFTLPLKCQVQENLHLGVTYTAILNGKTLRDGIFYLLNSNTMLKEQVHVADFDSYSALLCGKKC